MTFNPFLVNTESLKLLDRLLGSRWDYWGTSSTNPLPDRALVRMFVRTNAGFVRVSILESARGSFPDDPDITRLCLDHDNWDEAKARSSGGVFFQDRGKLVKDIRVIREREVVTFLDGSETVNEFDIGLIFEFDPGVVSFHRVNCYDVEFDIRRADSLSNLVLDHGAHRFMDSLEYRTEVSLSYPSVSILLDPSD